MDKHLAQLEALLVEEAAAHEQLEQLLSRKLDAFRASQRALIESLCIEESRQLNTVAELAKRRMTLIAELTRMLDPDAREPMSLLALAERLSEPVRGRLLVLRVQLRDQMEATGKRNQLLRSVAGALVEHMNGLVQTIGTRLSTGGVYGRRGIAPRAALSVSTFQVTG